MFLDFYKLHHQPFGVTPDPHFLYLSQTHRDALACLRYAIETDLGFSAILGEPGLGKTTLLFRILENFRASSHTAFVFETQCNSVGLLRYLLKELGAPVEDKDAAVLNERLQDVLLKAAAEGRRVILILDEAQNLDLQVLETVRLLSNLESPKAKLVHIILSGQPRLAEVLAHPAMEQLRQRIYSEILLEPMMPEETERYITHRLEVAGYHGEPLFTAAAVDAIAVQSGGVPRKINRICFNALSFGYLLGKSHIDTKVVEESATELLPHLLALRQENWGQTAEAGSEGTASQENVHELAPEMLAATGKTP